jgi:hypothetical protein
MSSFVLLLAAAAAHAEVLAWDWQPEQGVAYHAEITRERDEGDWHLAIENLEARAVQTNLVVDLDCRVLDTLKKGWEIRCGFHNVSVSGLAVGDEQDKLSTIFAEYEEHLEGAQGVFEMGSTGRIRSFDLVSFDPSNEREGQVLDAMRMLMIRPFAQLELELPRSGDDKGRSWKQGGSPILTQLRTSYGTAGAVVIVHRVESREGGLVQIGTEGRGTVAYGASVDADGTKTIAVDLAGSASFDPSAGVLASRESMVVGRFTAGSSYASQGAHFREIGSLERIDSIPLPTAAPQPAPEPEAEAPEAEAAAPEPAPETTTD